MCGMGTTQILYARRIVSIHSLLHRGGDSGTVEHPKEHTGQEMHSHKDTMRSDMRIVAGTSAEPQEQY